MSFKVVEIFESINGEGMRAGELAVFVRMKGCNLSCNYCDTMWANKPDCEFAEMTAEQIVDRVKKSGIKNVTLTGGEPLLQKDADKLLEAFSSEKDIRVEIETNGSIDLKPFLKFENVSFTMDYKLPESDMEKYMNTDNFKILRKKDTLKFVASSVNDLKKAKEMLSSETRYSLLAVKAREPCADSVKFRNRQYSLDERRTRKFLNTCSSPWKKFQGLFSLWKLVIYAID